MLESKLTENSMKQDQALLALSALAQATRLQLFRLLVTAGESGLTPGQLVQKLELPPATLSFHLKELRQALLITQKQDGRSLIYSANYSAMNELIAYLTENCCEGNACEVTTTKPNKKSILSF
jgi:ArsR family transcriptional regulator